MHPITDSYLPFREHSTRWEILMSEEKFSKQPSFGTCAKCTEKTQEAVLDTSGRATT